MYYINLFGSYINRLDNRPDNRLLWMVLKIQHEEIKMFDFNLVMVIICFLTYEGGKWSYHSWPHYKVMICKTQNLIGFKAQYIKFIII